MILSIEQKTQLKEMIESCVAKLYNEENALPTRKGMEHSILFRFGLYLDVSKRKIEWLKDLQLDVEYNKNGEESKITPRRPNGVRPDLIIHSRGDNKNNILVVEMKGWWNKKTRENDRIKLEDFTNQNGKYKYKFGVFIDLKETEAKCRYDYFVNGEKENTND